MLRNNRNFSKKSGYYSGIKIFSFFSFYETLIKVVEKKTVDGNDKTSNII